MKIAFNPSNSDKNILDLIKNNKDIIFDLKGHSIFARGVEFKGTDTWRPVVDNLISDSTTSSLSANQGRVLAGLINGHPQIIDMRNYDGSYWHPVTVPLSYNGYNKIKVSVQLNSGDKPSWATHDSGFTCNMEIWATAHGWGTTNAETICLNYTYAHCNSNPCGWKQLGYPSLGVLFLRGGARYKVWTDFDATFTPHDKTYTWTSENGGYTQSTGGPYTSCPGLDFIKNRIYANLNGTAENADKLDGYHASYSSNTPWGTIPVITTSGYMDIGKHLEFHRDNTTGSDYSTILMCTGNYSNIVNLPSESGTLALLSQVVSTSDFNWTNLPGKVVGGNEFNIVSAGFNNRMWFNYLPIDNRNSSAAISQYIMGNGNKGLASVYAKRFKVDGQGCMWKDARNYAPFYATFNGGFEPILDIKTVSGDWSIGSYDSTGNYLIFSFTSDSDYNAGVNGTAWYYITTSGTFSGASRYINHTPGDPQSYMHSTSTGTYGGAIQIREVNEVLNNQSAWGYAPRITFHWGQRYAKGFGMRSDGQFAVDDVPIALTSNVLTFDNDNADYLGANFNNPDFSKKAASKYIECWDGAGGWWNWMAGKFMKAGSSDAYVLLGGGGHKPLSEFQLGSGSYLPYNGWWASGSGQDINDANGMIFAYASHKNTPFSSAWGIITTFDYTYNSAYKFQLAANGYSNAMYYRSRSADRGGWTSWAQVIDTGNISSQTVDKSYHLRVNHSVSTNSTWSTWYWIGQSGQPTWLWGTNDGINCYVWNPSNFSVKYATSAGSVSNSLNIFGVSYNGSAAKTVTTSTFVSQLPEATGTVTDGTMFITSWASDNGFADTNAVNFPYKRKASCLWNYIDNKVSSKYLPLAGGTMNGNARIGHGSGNLYIGNSGNDGWIYTQDIASQLGTDKWYIRELGAAHFGNVYICTKSDYVTYDSSIIECYNDALYLNYYSSTKVILCKGGGSVGIGTVPSYKLDVNGQVKASGFHHESINSDNYILLAGGGYKSYGGSASNPIFLGYLNLYHGNDGTINSYFYCLGYSVSFTYTRGGNYCKISIPNTTHQVFFIKAAIASVNYSGGGIDNWTGEHRGDGAWWLHCYASGNNDVRVKGFRNSNGDNDSWWGGNPLYSGNGSANVITVCLFGYVDFR